MRGNYEVRIRNNGLRITESKLESMDTDLRLVKKKLNTFTDLDAWKEGHQLVLMVYRLTKSFPREEVYGLVSQMRRCSASVTSNIAEGFSRQSYKEKVQFYSMGLGSLTELQNDLFIARDVVFLATEDFNRLMQQSIRVHRIINCLIKSSKAIIRNS